MRLLGKPTSILLLLAPAFGVAIDPCLVVPPPFHDSLLEELQETADKACKQPDPAQSPKESLRKGAKLKVLEVKKLPGRTSSVEPAVYSPVGEGVVAYSSIGGVTLIRPDGNAFTVELPGRFTSQLQVLPNGNIAVTQTTTKRNGEKLTDGVSLFTIDPTPLKKGSGNPTFNIKERHILSAEQWKEFSSGLAPNHSPLFGHDLDGATSEGAWIRDRSTAAQRILFVPWDGATQVLEANHHSQTRKTTNNGVETTRVSSSFTCPPIFFPNGEVLHIESIRRSTTARTTTHTETFYANHLKAKHPNGYEGKTLDLGEGFSIMDCPKEDVYPVRFLSKGIGDESKGRWVEWDRDGKVVRDEPISSYRAFTDAKGQPQQKWVGGKPVFEFTDFPQSLKWLGTPAPADILACVSESMIQVFPMAREEGYVVIEKFRTGGSWYSPTYSHRIIVLGKDGSVGEPLIYPRAIDQLIAFENGTFHGKMVGGEFVRFELSPN